MFTKKNQEKSEDYEKYVSLALNETYYLTCMKLCIQDYSKPLDGKEKVCLAKCLDRAYDYLQIQAKNISPQNDTILQKYITKLDGNNILNFGDQKKQNLI